MKQLSKLTNVDKAKLLHQLLPGSIPGLIETANHIAQRVVDEQEQLAATWGNNVFITFGMWLQLAKDTQTTIKRYDKQLPKSAAIFADQLFDGYTALFVNHCVQEHAKIDGVSKDYINAVTLLYGND